MRVKRSPQEKAAMVRAVNIEMNQNDTPVKQACKAIGMSDATYYKYRNDSEVWAAMDKLRDAPKARTIAKPNGKQDVTKFPEIQQAVNVAANKFINDMQAAFDQAIDEAIKKIHDRFNP